MVEIYAKTHDILPFNSVLKRSHDRKYPEIMKRAFGYIRLLEYYLKMSIKTEYADWFAALIGGHCWRRFQSTDR